MINFTHVMFLLIVLVTFRAEITLGQPNLILNSDVESGTSSPSSWTTNIASGTMNTSWSTSEQVSGTHSLCTDVTIAGQGDWRQTITNIDDETIYRFRVHIKASNVTVGSHGVELQWFSDDNTYLGRQVFSATTANEWQEEKDNDITPPANASKVYILMRTYEIGTYYFDDPVFKRKDNNLYTIEGKFPIGLYSATQNDLVINGGAEDHKLHSAQSPLIWSKCIGSGTPTFFYDSTLKKTGEKSLKITLPGDGVVDWRQTLNNIDDNDSFNLKAQIYASNVASGSHAISLQWFDLNSTYLGQNTFSADVAGQWVSIDESNITPPAGAVKAYVLLRAYKAGSYNFDDIECIREQTATEKVTELKNAGYNLFLADAADLGAMKNVGDIYGMIKLNMDDTTSTTNVVNAFESKDALRIWHGNDEPAWYQPIISASTLVTGYDTIINEDDYLISTPHFIWLNHAPRGIVTDPSDFTTLRPYSAAADIISMDIYPVGLGGHSSLSDKTISCVGAYTEILYDDVCTNDTGLQDKIIWMVLQDFNWKDLNDASMYGVEVHWMNGSSLLKIDKFRSSLVDVWSSVSAQVLTPPSGAQTAVIALRAYGAGSYNFDDVVFSENGTNILANSDFETANGSYPASWTRIINSGTVSQTWDSSTYHSSSHSVKSVVTVNGQSEWRQVVTVDDSKTYSLTAYVKSSVDSELSGPTWEERRFMAYDAIINGARGLIYYGTKYTRANWQSWEDSKRLAGEISDLSDVLTSPTSFRDVTVGSSSIECLLLDISDTELYLIAANKTANSESNVSFEISGLDLSQIEEYNAASPETITNNSFSANFAAYEVKIWQIE